MIPVFSPILSGQEKKNLNLCVDTKWFSSNGYFNNKLEREFSKLVSRKYSSTVSNGTVALELALKALNIDKGSEVIVPTFTIISPILAILRCGLKPVLVDMDLKYWTVNTDQIEEKITKKTRAILVVHTYGFPADMDKILKIKKKYKISLVEDAAEMHGQYYKKRPCGSFGDISTFSFYSNKFISAGEGGILCTNNKILKKKIDKLRNMSFGKSIRFKHTELGFNYRMSNIHASIAYSQINNLKQTIKKKKDICRLYNKYFSNNKNITILPESNSYAKNIYWVYGILINKGSKKKIINHLKLKGIETRDFFVGMHNQPVLRKMKIIKKNDIFPISDYMEKKGFYIPSGPNISKKEIKFVANAINTFFRS